ncbi:hypothetical protein [Sulfurovum sp.]|uniref:hypothetical protein n=1 Tax=Sulfurovum sp. TaxID=1969726 RepID=UPI002867D5AF|nr:hypothetical protein [Sulfurovum sp.]
MKPTSKEYLEKVSKHCHNQIVHYKFNTTTLQVTDNYREGRLASLEYIGELVFYYMQEEKRIQQEFKEQIIKQLKFYSCLDDTEYKRGMYDALNEVLNS